MNTYFHKALALSMMLSSALHADVSTVGSEQEFQEKVIANGKPTIVVFSATWCGACQAVHDPFKELSNDPELGAFSFAEVDIDAVPALKDSFVHQGVPTFVFFDKGAAKNSFVGALDKDQLRDAIKSGFSAEPAAVADDMQMPAQAEQSEGFFGSVGNFFAGIMCKIKAIFSYIWSKITGLFGR